MTTLGGFNLIAFMRRHDAKLAHDSLDAFASFLDDTKPQWEKTHGRRASFNWDAITGKLTSALRDLMDDKSTHQITSHDLLALHERLDRKFREHDNTIACSDACQVALDMAIKAQHAPSRVAGVELVA